MCHPQPKRHVRSYEVHVGPTTTKKVEIPQLPKPVVKVSQTAVTKYQHLSKLSKPLEYPSCYIPISALFCKGFCLV